MKKGRCFELLTKALDSTRRTESTNSTAVENTERISLNPLISDLSELNPLISKEINHVSTTDSVLLDKVCDNTTTAATISSSSSSSTVSELFDSDDSVIDKDYVPPQRKTKSSIINFDSDSDIIENSQQNNIRVSESPEREEFEPENQDDQASENVIHLTKKGSVRKRKHYDTSLRERTKAKKELKTNTKYCVKPGCGEECKKKCFSIISENQRDIINKQFRNFTWREQYIYIINNTSQSIPARRTKKNPNSKVINRGKTITYFMPNENNEKVTVCKTFFLTTLGFEKKNDKVLRNALKQAQVQEITDMRGCNPNPKKIDNKPIIDHINSFHPAVSHYRRVHAPPIENICRQN